MMTMTKLIQMETKSKIIIHISYSFLHKSENPFSITGMTNKIISWFNDIEWGSIFTENVIITIGVIGGVIVAILMAIFVFQCYHRGVIQRIRELFITADCRMNTFKLLTYNICMRPPMVSNSGDDFKNMRLELFIQNVIEHFDVIFIQDLIGAYTGRRAHLIEVCQLM